MKSNTAASIITILLLLMASNFTHAASVFKVTKGDSTLYLGGTIHILTVADYPLPEPYETAFDAADKLVFETDIAAIEAPEFQQQVLPVMLQKPGGTLNQQLSERTQNDLNAFITERGIPTEQIQGFTPAGASLALTMSEYAQKGFTQEGVDKFYFDKGMQNEMPISWLESVESQVALIGSLNAMDANVLIQYTLKDLSRSDEVVTNLHEGWKAGDMDKLTEVAIDEWKREFPSVYADFLTKRNNAWYPQIVEMLEDDQVEYVLVGALHLAGEDGLIYLLEQDGYKVEKL
ncbi:MAG: TraB/GumN family protein [Pseudomonadota bacterium]